MPLRIILRRVTKPMRTPYIMYAPCNIVLPITGNNSDYAHDNRTNTQL